MEIVQQLQTEAKLLQSRGLLVRFYPKSVPDLELSKQHGYKVNKTIDFINIKWDNDDSEVDRPVRHDLEGVNLDLSEGEIPEHLVPDPMKYPAQWAAYKNGQADQVIGIPIDVLFPNDPGKADTYKHANIRTVEQLESTPDSTLQRFPGGLADKALSGRFLSKAKDNFALEQIQAETNNTKEENDFLKSQVKELQLQMSRLVEQQLKAAKADSEVEEKKTKKKATEE